MKSILIILLMSISIFADTFIFEVENTTMVDAYGNIFNAMASLFQSPDYIGLLKLAFLAGGTGVFLVGVLKSSQSSGSSAVTEFGKYMIVGTSLLTLVFSNASTIYVKTNNMPSICTSGNTSNSQLSSDPFVTGAMVANVPTTLAWTFTTLNRIGVETTLLAKTAFSTLSTSAVSEPGSRGGFASYLTGVGAVTSLSLDDITSNTQLSPSNSSTIGSTLVAITNDCILIPAGQDTLNGPDVINTMKRTGDIKLTIDELLTKNHLLGYINPTTVTPISDIPNITLGGIAPTELLVSLNGEMFACKDAYLTLKARLLSLETSGAVECQESLKGAFGVDTINILTGGTAAGTVSNARNIALNSAMANQIFDSKRNLAIGSEVSFAAGKSMSEFTTQSLGSGYYMAQMLPYLQMGIRAVLYAFFPFVFVVILLPGGIKVLISYLQSLVWIELWTPTAAILDMFLGLVAKEKFADMYNSKGFNPTNGMQSFSDAAMLASVAGYLYASVPALTYLILKGSAQMLGNITSGVASGMSRNLDSATINRDIGDMKKLGAVNKELESKGQKMVSLAEMDSLEAGHMAAKNAGAWLTNQAHVGDLLSSSKGAELSKIIGGNISNATLDNKQAQDAAMIKATVGIKQDIATQNALGLNTPAGAAPGSIGNDDNIKKLTEIKAKEEQTKVAIAGKTQELQGTAGTNPDSDKNIKKIAGIEATDATIKLESKDKYQKLMGSDVINETSTVNALKELDSVKKFGADVEQRMKNTGASAADAVIQTAQIAGKDDAYKYEQIKETLDHYAGEKGTIGKDGKLHYNPKGEENILKNKEKIAAIAADIDIGKNKAEISSSDWQTFTKRAKEQEKSKAMATQTENRNIVQKLAAHGDGKAASLEKELARVNKKGQAIYSESQKSMKRAEYIATSNKDAAAFQTMSSQGEAVKSLQYALGGKTTGELKAMIAKTNVDSGKDLGQAMINNGGGTIMKLAQSNLKLGGKDYNQLSPIQKTAVAAEAISIMSNTPKAQSTAVSNVAAHGNQKAYKGNAVAKLADKEQTKTQADVAMYDTFMSWSRGDRAAIGNTQAYLSGIKGVKTVATAAKDVVRIGNKTKDKGLVAKDKIQKYYNNSPVLRENLTRVSTLGL